MNPQGRFVLLVALVVVAAYGWGSAAVAVLTRGERRRDGVVELDVAMRIAIGVALFLCVGGYAVALGVAGFAFLLGWQLVGALLALMHWRRDRFANTPSQQRGRLVVCAAVGLFLALLAFGAALTGPYNANDDGPAYLYLAQRLLATGGLIDPFNTRRVSSYGGGELYQALVLRVSGNGTVLGVEWFLFALLLVALVLGSSRRRFAAEGLVVIGLAVIVVRPIGAWANVAPSFSGAALTFALLRLLGPLRRSEEATWRFLLAGLLLASLFALRVEFFPPAAVLVVGGSLTLTRGRARGHALFAAAVAAVAGIAGWAVALASSSGTPLFPLLGGNFTEGAEGRDPALRSVGQHLHRLAQELGTAHLGVMILGSLALLALLMLFDRPPGNGEGDEGPRCSRRALLLVLLFAGSLAELTVESYALSGAALSDVGRYSAPSVLAGALYALDGAWAFMADGGRPSVALSARTRGRRVRNFPSRVVAAAAAVVLLVAMLGTGASGFARSLRYEAAAGVDVASGRRSIRDHFASQRATYARLDALVPRGERVFAAVDLPGLLDLSRFSFATLDIPGGTSPAPHLPLNGGAVRIATYLRSLGYRAVVATSPRAGGLYSRRAAEANLSSGVTYYAATARDFLAWDDAIQEMNLLFRTQRVGLLEYISIDEPADGTAGRVGVATVAAPDRAP